MKIAVRFITRLLSICGMLFFCHGSFAEQATAQVFILDASGSMWGQIEGKNKITIARDVMGNLIQQLPDDSQAGLVVYGHRRKGDCNDIETLSPLGPIDKAVLTNTINGLNPKGKTPITDSVKQAIDLVRTSEHAANIILVSDGLETCGGDPCKAVKDARAAGVNFVMHVVGFGIEEKENVSSLECAAQAGGGLYFDAKNADELSAALEQVVEKPPVVTGGNLTIKAIADGKLSDALIRIRDTETDEEIAGGRTYRSDQTNPRKFLLPAGRYKATIQALEFKGDVTRQLDDIVIVEGEAVEHTIDFSSGSISIKVVRNGKLSDAGVNITRADDSKSVAGGRTYKSDTSNPAVYKLTPGIYNVTVNPIEFKGGKKKIFENIEVKAGETHEEVVDFSSGKFSVRVLINDKPGDATVNVSRPDDGTSVAGGRTYTSEAHNPIVQDIAPGIYNITVKPVAFKGGKKKVFENIEVKAGETYEETVEYVSGSISVKVTENGKLHDATVGVYKAGTIASVGGGRTYTSDNHNPNLSEVNTGNYDVVIKSIRINGDTRHKFENVEVSKGQTVELVHDYETGILQVTTHSGTESVTADINVIDTKTGQSVANVRSHGGKEFHLLPGDYVIKSKAKKVAGSVPQEVNVSLEAGKTAEANVDFSVTNHE